MGPIDDTDIVRQLKKRLAECEDALGHMRGSCRGVIAKLWDCPRDRCHSAVGIIERALHKSVTRYYKYPLADEPDDPTRVVKK